MIEALPNRRLSETEVDQLRESKRFKNIDVKKHFSGQSPRTVERIVITLANGTEKEIAYGGRTRGWKIVSPDSG